MTDPAAQSLVVVVQLVAGVVDMCIHQVEGIVAAEATLDAEVLGWLCLASIRLRGLLGTCRLLVLSMQLLLLLLFLLQQLLLLIVCVLLLFRLLGLLLLMGQIW